MADPIKRLAAALSTLHGARCRSAPDDAIERCQNELERAALAVVGADHAGMLPECQACHGSGRRNLTPTEAATLANLARGCELAGPDLRHRAARALIDRGVEAGIDRGRPDDRRGIAGSGFFSLKPPPGSLRGAARAGADRDGAADAAAGGGVIS